jgi:hypothetical protein
MGCLIPLGRFLDEHNLENSTKDKIRNVLISMYVFLYDYPKRVKRSILNLLDSAYTPQTSNDRKIETRSKWALRLYFLFYIPLFSIGFAYLAQYVFKPDVEGLAKGLTREEAWWFGLLVGIPIAFTGPTVLATLLFVVGVVSVIPVLIFILILETVRRLLLILLNKSTSPKTSPFSYFCALLTVLTPAIALAQYVLGSTPIKVGE